ncbi:hypothetical protein HG66A1_61680 [Gimesia chilikensis]|uniref:Uncharacterized protein n=1 Tax=Gimesia chilikensis TaxID=2605989 RepID=A0A517PY80_9PLAN|nr:hypothetical protein HG66A1_61680 [Gimesia chilikensis]
MIFIPTHVRIRKTYFVGKVVFDFYNGRQNFVEASSQYFSNWLCVITRY